MTVNRSTNRNLFPLGRGCSRLVLISESGLYKLIIRSGKPEAEAFQDWLPVSSPSGILRHPVASKDSGVIIGKEKAVTGEMSEEAHPVSGDGHTRALMVSPLTDTGESERAL